VIGVEAKRRDAYRRSLLNESVYIIAEAEKSQARFGEMASMHEGYGVLAEEVAELFDAVRLKQTDPTRAGKIAREAMQVAAVALRIAESAKRVTR
jgi:NTP pyrophosphatase (non-canonical NTP hydrolase)